MGKEFNSKLLERLKDRCKVALLKESEPTLESVLDESARHGVLIGSVDTLFKKWKLYMQYIADRIPMLLSLPDEKTTRFKQFISSISSLLDEAEKETREKLSKICRAVEGGHAELTTKSTNSFHICSNGNCIYSHGITHPTYSLHLNALSANLDFPDVLSERELEPFQLGWRASDESVIDNRPMMGTTQPWQLIAWLATRFGNVWVNLHFVNVTSRGITLAVRAIAKDWKQKLSKEKAIRLSIDFYQRGDYRPLLTWWLGDGVVDNELHRFQLSIGSKYIQVVNQAFRGYIDSNRIRLMGKDAKMLARQLILSAGSYGILLDVLRSHKWKHLKALANASYKEPVYITIGEFKMRLLLTNKFLIAVKQFKNKEEAELVVKKLAPHAHIYRSKGYIVYVKWSWLKELMKRDPTLRETIVQYLIKKAETKPQARKILAKIPLF